MKITITAPTKEHAVQAMITAQHYINDHTKPGDPPRHTHSHCAVYVPEKFSSTYDWPYETHVWGPADNVRVQVHLRDR